jgi:hypothetical protein
MGGGLLQLASQGSQDKYLTGNPQITYFKMLYRRYTNFAIESIQQTFSNTIDFGKKVSATISRNGDLLYKAYIQVIIPQIDCGTSDSNRFRWLNWLGHIMIKSVDIEIGGHQIDKHYSDWLHIWNEISQKSGQKENYASMIGNLPRITQVVRGHSSSATTVDSQNTLDDQGAIPSVELYIPLNFWFCRSPGLALPLISLQQHDVKINVELRNAEECCWSTGKYSTTPPVLSSGLLFCDYIYLDVEERRRFANGSHEYLIEQLQYHGDERTTTTSNKIKLAFNHPVKMLAWIAQPLDFVNATTMAEYGGRQWFNYSDQIDVSYYNGTPQDALGNGMVSSNNVNFGLPLTGVGVAISGATAGSENPQYRPDSGTTSGGGVDYASGGFVNILAPSATAALTTDVISADLPLFDFGSGCVSTAKLVLNGHDRFSERTDRYFNHVQPYQHCSNGLPVGMHLYSFALDPENVEPSGTCNFSKIDSANLTLNLTAQAVKNSRTTSIRIYALSYNVLKIANGMGGLAYSS